MDDSSRHLAAPGELGAEAADTLRERGFVVLPGPAVAKIRRLASAYDAAVASAADEDVKAGSTTTRVNDFVNRGAEFDALYTFPPLLEACAIVIGGRFKLSSFHARTLRPHTLAQELHVDVHRNSRDWPLVGFIFMVDEFRPDNGATRFIPGSHRRLDGPEQVMPDPRGDYDGQVLACGPAGSLLIFNGSVWHGHTANRSHNPRRSLQGAFIPRDGTAATNFSARMHSETHNRLSPSARQVLGF